MPFLRVNELETYYEVHGEGEPIVLLHNGFSCTKMWEEVQPILTENGFRVVMFDRRGSGQSEGGADFEEYYNGEHFREGVVKTMAALMAFLDIGRFHIVGQCEGGVIGVDYAVEHPDQVKTLTTASTLCYSEITLEEFNIRKFPPSFDKLTTEIQKKYFYWHGHERAEYFYKLCSRYGGCYGRDYFDLRDKITLVPCPTLVMYPDRGHFFDVEQGLAFYRHLPKGQLAVFPRCGHNIFEHYPGEYANKVIQLVKRYPI